MVVPKDSPSSEFDSHPRQQFKVNMNAPLFNVDEFLWSGLRERLLEAGKVPQYAYLTVSEGHVIAFGGPRPDILGRFKDDAHAESMLLKTGWTKRNDRFFASEN